MNDLVKFQIPASFVLERLLPDASELVYGYDHGWVHESDAVAIALAMREERPTTSAVEDLALLLSDDLARVPELVRTLTASTAEADSNPTRAWIYLALAWVRANEELFVDPYEVVEMIYTDFEYPPSIAGFVRFMPQPAGEPAGYSAMDQRWDSFLQSESEYFDARRNHN